MYSTSTVPCRPMMLSKQRTPLRVRLRRIVGRDGGGVGVDFILQNSQWGWNGGGIGVKWGRLADRDRDRDMDSDMTDGRDRGRLGRGKGGQGQGQGQG